MALAVELERSEDVAAFGKAVTEFYRRFGVGKFGLNKAFRIEEIDHEVHINPITNVEHIYLDDIIACVNETLDYHPDTGVSTEWLEKNFNCPIELLGHGTLPHRVLGEHHHHH